ncbi:MAG: insulinase family protein [Planctomycetota bacterium]|nr:MAG: insulinase family protein [Planctomycetota bacterium]
MEFREHTLDNGLQVVAECNPEAHSTAVGFFVQTGARDESEADAGVSHFLEHMVFKGTPSRTADDVNRQFDEMGAHYNAFTSEEHTVYYAAVLPEHQQASVELLGDILRPSLREEDFDTEKQVIIEEIRMYEDQPPFGADDKCRALHYGKHPLGKSVLGTVQSITDLSVDAMRAYFKRRYSPGNVTLVGAGKIDFDALVKTAEQACGKWTPVESGRETPEAAAHRAFQCVHKDSAALEYVLQLANGPGATDADRYAAKVLATVIGDDSGSRLYWALVDTGLAEHASLSHHDYQGAGLYMTYMSCDAENTEANLARIAEIYTHVEKEGLAAAEVAQAKSKINSRVVLGSERPRGRLFTVGGNWIQRHEYRTVREDLDAVEALTRDDLAAVLARYPLSINTTLAIGPAEKVSAPPAG